MSKKGQIELGTSTGFISDPKTTKIGDVVWRQGDISGIAIDTIPSDAVEIRTVSGRYILAEGEATGHSHYVPCAIAASSNIKDGSIAIPPEGKVYVTRDDTGAMVDMFLDPGKDTVIEHEDHSPPIPAGLFGPTKIVGQKEYVWGEMQRVAD